MTWFKVDDRLHAHPKALATSLAALGLWTVAGSWSSDHLTDGFMPDHVIPLLGRGSTELADELVDCGLWRRVRGGYRFHQWHDDGNGNRRNATKKEVVDIRHKRAEAGRKGGLASGNARSKPEAKTKQVLEQEPSTGSPIPNPLSVETKGGEDLRAAGAHGPPLRTCPEHADVERPPRCGPCADARRANEAWWRANPPRVAVPAAPMPGPVEDVLAGYRETEPDAELNVDAIQRIREAHPLATRKNGDS